jgi:S1-C subfamily serine protease
MAKFTLYTLILLFFCTSIGTNRVNAGEVDKKLHKECLYPTVYVGRADGHGSGSGVVVRSEKVEDHLYKNVFITCAHIFDANYKDYEVREFIYEDWSQIKGIKSFPSTFVSFDTELDLGIGVFFSDHEMPIAQLNFEPKLFIGNEIFRIGCGLGDEPRLDYGKLTSYKKLPKEVFRTSVMTVPGDSGGPLFHENKVIGIIVSIRAMRGQPVFGISHAVPLKMFKKWSEANNNNLDFAWDTTKELPELQFRYLKFKEYEIKK